MHRDINFQLVIFGLERTITFCNPFIIIPHSFWWLIREKSYKKQILTVGAFFASSLSLDFLSHQFEQFFYCLICKINFYTTQFSLFTNYTFNKSELNVSCTITKLNVMPRRSRRPTYVVARFVILCLILLSEKLSIRKISNKNGCNKDLH